MLSQHQIEWIEEQLSQNGLVLTGKIETTHDGAWSGVATVPTAAGLLYFKETAPALIFEVRLTVALHQWGWPVPTVVAADTGKGWLLLADSGQSLRSLLQSDGDIQRWHTVVTQYAQMQIGLSKRVGELLDMGIFDRRLNHLPLLFAELLTDTDAMMIDQDNGLTAVEYAQLKQLAAPLATWCQRLATFGIPESLHHDDFHDNNIFVRNGQYIFADWGEACLAHPFFSMIIVLRIAAYILKLADDDHALTALRDTYLAQWEAYGTKADLLTAFKLAQTIGAVNRALTWYTMLGFMDEVERAKEADSVPGWLQEFLAQSVMLQD